MCTTSISGILYTPRIATNFELWGEIVRNASILSTDIFELIAFIDLNIELFLIDRAAEALTYIYPALTNEALFVLEQKNTTNLYNVGRITATLFNVYFVLMFFLLGSAYLVSYGIRSSSKVAALSEGGWALYAYLDEVEEECGQIEDGIVYVAYFLAFVLWFYLFNLFFSTLIIKHLNWLLVLFCFVLCLGAIIPTSVLNWMGVAFGQYVRGSSRSTSLFFETLLDFVSVSVIFIRFFVQNVRFVFIFVAFFELYESIIVNQTIFSRILTPHITWSGYWAGEFNQYYNLEILIFVIYQSILYFYYVAHLTVTYIAQLAIFIILSFWIFFFLYTTFTLPSRDKFFFYKRYVLLQKE